MRKRILMLSLAAIFLAFVLLGFLVDRVFFYLVLILAMVIMHLFGHGHRHENHESEHGAFRYKSSFFRYRKLTRHLTWGSHCLHPNVGIEDMALAQRLSINVAIAVILGFLGLYVGSTLAKQSQTEKLVGSGTVVQVRLGCLSVPWKVKFKGAKP